ncbi:ATP-binding protein [Thalassobaculum sp. OXR-137]|uniref:sensor histidine kinase n=1 Tax=Thalassobaculum sp. OXR-137 TaxID=3100173 RepID=UPI002AC8C68B|nr:ATP-binding protein [Thalassobaculum sp. OXR-137]WPZ36440.1 ATP-binding protein [Thalassobaculum sp. OXR-137]
MTKDGREPDQSVEVSGRTSSAPGVLTLPDTDPRLLPSLRYLLREGARTAVPGDDLGDAERVLALLSELPALASTLLETVPSTLSEDQRRFDLLPPDDGPPPFVIATFHSASLASELEDPIRHTLALIRASRPPGLEPVPTPADLRAWRKERALAHMRRAVIITDRDQRILWVNPAFERITGFRRTDAVGAVCDDLLRYKELNPAVVSLLASHQVERQPFDHEIRILNAWGAPLTVNLERHPDVDPTGRLVWLSLLTETSETAERDRADAEKRSLAIAELHGQWYFETDAEDRFVRVWGAPAVAQGRRIGARREDVSAEDTTTQKWDQYRKALERREPYRDFIYRVKATPVDRLVLVSGTPRFDPQGTFLGYEGVSRDVTDIERNRVNSMLVGAALEGIQELIALFDDMGTVLFMNQAFLQTFGIDPKSVHLRETTIEDLTREIIQRGDPTLDAETREMAVVDRLQRYWAATGSHEYRFGDRWIRIHDRPTSDGGRLVVGFDNSQARASNEAMTVALEKAEASARAADAFLARMSHELRTPLNAIIGLSELMTADQLSLAPDKLKEYAWDINRSGRHLLELIQDILEFSSIRSRDRTLAEDAVDVTAVAAEAEAIVRSILSRRQQTLSVANRLSPEDRIKGDARAVKQIMINLLTNASKYGSKSGGIWLELERRDDRISITVIDDGPGISPRDLPHVFDPFYRGMNPMNASVDSEDVDGTGLGLAIVKTMAERMDGEVSLDSSAKTGTRVKIDLPAIVSMGPG